MVSVAILTLAVKVGNYTSPSRQSRPRPCRPGTPESQFEAVASSCWFPPHRCVTSVPKLQFTLWVPELMEFTPAAIVTPRRRYCPGRRRSSLCWLVTLFKKV